MISEDKEVDVLFWHSEGLCVSAIAAKAGVSSGCVDRVIARGRIRTPEERRGNYGQGNQHLLDRGAYLPSAAEIEEGCKRMRDGWTQLQEKRRAKRKRRQLRDRGD